MTGDNADGRFDGRLIYVVGCGRSGTTILGFCLGNATDTLDLGEVLDFARFHGKPNGFGPESENYLFWQRVCDHLHKDSRWPGFETFRALQRRFDRHGSVVPLLVMEPMLRPLGLSRYRQALTALYEAIFLEADQRTCIDSSKYPSRLMHLAAILPTSRIAVVHLIRDPATLVEAFSRADQGPPRAALPSLLYYTFVNAAASFVLSRHRGITSARLKYETLVTEPESVLGEVGLAIGLDMDSSIAKIASKTPLKRGYIFNGNRMRTQEQIVLKRAPPPACQPPTGGWLLRAIRNTFYC